MAPRKGSEFSNINETWQRNEQNRPSGEDDKSSGVSEDLQNTIEEEATEYDNANKEERLPDSERASMENAAPDNNEED